MSRTLDVPGGRTVQLQYPRSMPEEFVQRTLIPAVEGGVRTLASTTAAVHRAVVTTYLENKLRIAYLAWDARVAIGSNAVSHSALPHGLDHAGPVRGAYGGDRTERLVTVRSRWDGGRPGGRVDSSAESSAGAARKCSNQADPG